MWLLANKKKFWIWFASVFVILLLIGTFLDYQINDLVADLRHGSYISSNTYATLMEVLGESPVYLFLTYSFVIIGLNLSLNNGTKFKVFAGLSIAVACFCMYKVLHGYCKYIYEHVENDIWTSIGMQITCIVLGILLTVLATFLFYRFTNFEDNGYSYYYFASDTQTQVETIRGVRVTSIERTIVDSINMLGKVMDTEELIKCIELVHLVNEQKIREMLLLYNKDILFRKVGYILSFFRDEFHLSDEFFDFCKKESNVANIGYLCSNETKDLEFVNQWGLYAFKNLRSLTNKGGIADV